MHSIFDLTELSCVRKREIRFSCFLFCYCYFLVVFWGNQGVFLLLPSSHFIQQFCLSVYISICIFVLSVCIAVCVCLSVCLCMSACVCLFVCLYIYICLSVCLSPSIYLYLQIYLFICSISIYVLSICVDLKISDQLTYNHRLNE